MINTNTKSKILLERPNIENRNICKNMQKFEKRIYIFVFAKILSACRFPNYIHYSLKSKCLHTMQKRL